MIRIIVSRWRPSQI